MKTRLVFKGSEVRRLLDDSAKAKERTVPYVGVVKNQGPGLILVKDDGIYLLSNAKSEEGKAPLQTGLIAYAKGYEAPSRLRTEGASDDDAWGAQYEKIRDAVGGDDFAEAVNLPASVDKLLMDGMDLILYLTKDEITIQIRRAA
jgi:hypothetical protein